MTQQLILDLLPAPPPTLDNFVAGRNDAALDALRHCQPGRAIYLWGLPGAGRTHLLQALGAVPPNRYFGPLDEAAALKDIALSDAVPPALIAVDDVERLNEDAQAALFALYNRWRESSNTSKAFALLLSGDQPPLAMPLREDLRTRLGWDLVFRMELLSDDDRAEALMARSVERGLRLSPEVVNWVLTHYARDMSQLTALLDALDRYSLEKQRPITLPLLKDLLATTQKPDDPAYL
jgi:DnaA family protein